MGVSLLGNKMGKKTNEALKASIKDYMVGLAVLPKEVLGLPRSNGSDVALLVFARRRRDGYESPKGIACVYLAQMSEKAKDKTHNFLVAPTEN